MMELWPFTNFHDLNLDWIIKVIKEWNKKLDQFFNGGGIHDFVEQVLTEHPEWTTTVMDGAISTAKLMDDVVTREKIANGVNDYLTDVVNTRGRITTAYGTRTSVYTSIIPADHKPELVIANDIVNTFEDPAEAAARYGASVLINAGLQSTAQNKTLGYVVQDHTVINSEDYATGEPDSAYLYMDSDGVLGAIPDGPTITNIMQQYDPDWLIHGWYPFIENGVYTGSNHTNVPGHPRTWIAQDIYGNYMVGVCGGRDQDDEGMSIYDMYDYIVNQAGFQARFAYSLDGGGSSCLYVDGIRQNSIIDGDGVRKCTNFIAFRKDDEFKLENTKNTSLMTSQSLAWIWRYLYNYVGSKVITYPKLPLISSRFATDDTNECRDSTGFYSMVTATANNPLGEAGVLLVWHDHANTARQVAMCTGKIYFRQIYTDPNDSTVTYGTWSENVYLTRKSGGNVSWESGVAIAGSGYINTYGHIVTIDLDIGVTGAIANNTVMASNLPTPPAHTAVLIYFDNGDVKRAQIKTDGKMYSKGITFNAYTQYGTAHVSYLKA